jgi:hypothetical protein
MGKRDDGGAAVKDEPMTAAQAKYLKHLTGRAAVPFDPNLSKEQARWVIGELALADQPSPDEVRAADCPQCGAEAGAHCIRERNHEARVKAAREAARRA